MTHFYTPDQIDFLKRNVKGRGNGELTELFNAHFGTNLKVSQLRACKNNRGLKSGLDGRFKQGHIPVNKGTQGLYNVGGNRTSFKPGQPALNYKPVGYERIDRDGYTLVKVQDDGPWHKRWRHKHKVIWEEANGPIPSGHALLFADQNKQNISLSNLILISKKQLSTLNKKGLLSNNADLTRTGIVMADLIQKICDRKRSS